MVEECSPAAPADLIVAAKSRQRRSESSPYLGVHWDIRRERWAAIICKGMRTTQIAQFDDPEAAAIAYDRVVLALFGKTAERNFPKRQLKPASIKEMRKWSRDLWKMSKSSMYRGVMLTKSGHWLARASKAGVQYNLGTYSSEIEAARAYDKGAKELWGRKAVLNFK